MKSVKPFAWAVYGIFVFLLFEAVLFCSGRVLLLQRRIRAAGAPAVVCAGDSHTFGVGTSAPYSYPHQLAALLNSNNKSQKFSVVNLGIPGSSTQRQIRELRSHLEHQDARIVILLTGRNNEADIGQWGITSRWGRIVYGFGNVRVVRFMKVLCARFLNVNRVRDNGQVRARAEYLNFYLEAARKLCRDKGAKLVLLSYYNSSDDVIKEFAGKYHIPYLEFTGAFDALFREEGSSAYISPDMSHLNHRGYKFFAERLYERLFLQQATLGVTLNALTQTPGERDFYSDADETESMVRAQKERIARSKGTGQYPFELVHLGHIYMEAGNSEGARECYGEALQSFDYGDNNTIVAPLINWYVRAGRIEDAIKICDEILLRNPSNTVARSYRDRLFPR
jgi:pentatricopeptide repeat protein